MKVYRVNVTNTLRDSSGSHEGKMLGVRINALPLESLVAAAGDYATIRQGTFVFACANPHSLVVARSDKHFRLALDAASAVVADGVGCIWAAKLAGESIGPRITGTDFFLSVMSMLDRRGGRVFFFGSSTHVLAKIVERTSREFPNVTIGTRSPPYGMWPDVENAAMVRDIADFRPDVLWIGMTAPKQEKWAYANAADLGVPVIGSIGAVFDYYAGVTRRAPTWICNLGLEWLYRLPREPTRLWRRTFVSAPIFLWSVVRERISGSAR